MVNHSGNITGDRKTRIGANWKKEESDKDNDKDSDTGTYSQPDDSANHQHSVATPAPLSTADGTKRQTTSPALRPSVRPPVQPPVRPPSAKAFLSVVHHQVSAYVTWPETLAKNCGSDDDAQAVTSLSSPTGYLFRYRNDVSETDRFVVRNLTRNAILLDGLVPDSKYRYQVKYLFGSTRSSWSGESSFDTRYERPVP